MYMAIRKIVTIPDPVLRNKAQKVNGVGEEEKKLAQDLLDTLEVAKDPEGAGIAATQIGVSKKMCVVRNFFPNPAKNGEYTHEDYVLINPKIVSTSKETEVDYEGCLSVPNVYGKVERYKKIKVDATDISGDRIKIKAQDFFARTIQHEIDHLEGVLFTDRVIGGVISEQEMDTVFAQEEQ
jgi:peptide deformylase